jgi:hypothetical protein
MLFVALMYFLSNLRQDGQSTQERKPCRSRPDAANLVAMELHKREWEVWKNLLILQRPEIFSSILSSFCLFSKTCFSALKSPIMTIPRIIQ